ncbi:flagellar hook-basal body complex protein FliE [Texcoconibacillus texcoconensis]|uniref:Flagellar hook-basal body complex protein FliE n=1 Tax=Texcoconibacillus texcoconensis TaxID=1095777 RepID=A0A840QL45_9BACI|nr:flagellar hook-basal body complex protein FliE [Texcoconibacillus texcoconensis]MBB5172081.1 flagellar hook-basal body complex protein FliE [Texcoconibacillus texcoconensis]
MEPLTNHAVQMMRPQASTPTAGTTQQRTSTHEAQQSFKQMLSDSIRGVNESQKTSEVATQRMARGDDIDLHEVMIAGQKADITLRTATEIRDKAVEAYQEVMRMQI